MYFEEGRVINIEIDKKKDNQLIDKVQTLQQ